MVQYNIYHKNFAKVLLRKWNSKYFKLFPRKKKKKAKMPNECFKANQPETRPEKGQKVKRNILRPTNLIQAQILKFGQNMSNLATLSKTMICYHTFCHVVNRSCLLPKPTFVSEWQGRLNQTWKGRINASGEGLPQVILSMPHFG